MKRVYPMVAGAVAMTVLVALAGTAIWPPVSMAEPAVTQTVPIVNFARQTITFEPHTGGLHQKTAKFELPFEVGSAEVALTGFEVGFSKAEHQLRSSTVHVTDVRVNGRVVEASVSIGIRDNSGNYDDRFEGSVDLLVIATPR